MKDNTIKIVDEVNIFDGSFDPLTELIRKGARDLIAGAVEAELQVLLDGFSNVKTLDGRAGVVRNGFQPTREILTSVGSVKVRIPKVRSRTGDPVTFRSVLVPPYLRKARSLEAAIPWLYLKGVSSGEMGDALKVLVGDEAAGLSPAVVSRLKTKWAGEYDVWCKQDLTSDEFVYIWVDGIHSGLRTPAVDRIDGNSDKLCCLVVIGVTSAGEKRFLAVTDGDRESKQSWKQVLVDLKSRGMNVPKLAVGDGAMGFWAAADEIMPEMKHQRCWVHKTCNIMNYLPKSLEGKAKVMLKEIYMSPTVDHADKAFEQFVKTFEAKYPKAIVCLQKDRDELLAFYSFPAQHWQSIRTTNPIESSFATIRHRTKRSKGCLSKSTMLHMIYKLAMTAENNWNRLKGFNQLPEVAKGVTFINGEHPNQQQETMINQTAA